METFIKKKFPYKVDFIENTWIKLNDENRIAASIWLPKNNNKKFSTILEYIPYRKRDATAIRDSTMHPYYAGHGYVCIRIDMRGTGDSDGIMFDEYLPQEIEDGLEIINWITKQKWSDGNVGMTGISWGGIVCLQMAIRQPKALKAIIPVHYSLERYYDDAGYFLGCYPGQTIGWGALMEGFNSRPPDPLISGKNWKKKWIDRLKKTDSFLNIWLNHQQNDNYWLKNSISQKYSNIKIPTLAVGGWADCWPNSVIKLIENTNTKCFGIIGPWGHTYPHIGKPGPSIGFLQESLKFFNSFLKNNKNNFKDLRLWINSSHSPNPKIKKKKGYWVSLNKKEINKKKDKLYFDINTLNIKKSQLIQNLSISSSLTCGLDSGEYMPWFASGYGAELPDNQIIDDAKSVVFDSTTLKNNYVILGKTSLTVELSSNKNFGMIAVRLCEIDQNRNSNLITFGILNLNQIKGKKINYKIKANKKYKVIINLNHTGYEFKKNNKIRISISTSYWPMAWPLHEKFKLKIYLKNSFVELPKRIGLVKDNSFKKAEQSKPLSFNQIIKPRRVRQITKNIESEDVIYSIKDFFGKIKLKDANLITENFTSQKYFLNENDPLSAKAQYDFQHFFQRSKWLIDIKGLVILTCDKKYFYLETNIIAKYNHLNFFKKNKIYKILRKGF